MDPELQDLINRTVRTASNEEMREYIADARTAAVMLFTGNIEGNALHFVHGSASAVDDYLVTNYHVVRHANQMDNGRYYVLAADHNGHVGFAEVVDFNSLSTCTPDGDVNRHSEIVDLALLAPVSPEASPELYTELLNSYTALIDHFELTTSMPFSPQPFTLSDIAEGTQEARQQEPGTLIPIVLSGNPGEETEQIHQITQTSHLFQPTSASDVPPNSAATLSPISHLAHQGFSGAMGVSLNSGNPVMVLNASGSHSEAIALGVGAPIERLHERLANADINLAPLTDLSCTSNSGEWVNHGLSENHSETSAPTIQR